MPKTQHRKSYPLHDSPFFRLSSRKKLARLLRVSSEQLSYLVSGQQLYLRRWKHKKLDQWLKLAPQHDIAENYRAIDIPDPRLKAIQARIATLLSRLKPPEFLYSPVKGKSYVDNAALHVGSKSFWLLDIADYFPSCSANNVARFFKSDMQCSPDVTAFLVKLVTLDGCLPQGSPCSPILAYFCNMPMWLAVAECAASANCKLSVYADDITISGEIVPKKTVWEIKKIIVGNGLKLKSKKEVSLTHSPADITGVIVKEDGTYLPNRQLKKLAELKRLRSTIKDPKEKIKIENKIHGSLVQRRQVIRIAEFT
jgi:hypothetical protein